MVFPVTRRDRGSERKSRDYECAVLYFWTTPEICLKSHRRVLVSLIGKKGPITPPRSTSEMPLLSSLDGKSGIRTKS